MITAGIIISILSVLILGWIIIAIMRATINAIQNRPCPHCLSQIKKRASVCACCGRDVVPAATPEAKEGW